MSLGPFFSRETYREQSISLFLAIDRGLAILHPEAGPIGDSLGNKMQCRESSNPLDAIHERELNELKELTVHRELAVVAALYYCGQEGISAPAWLAQEVAELAVDLLKKEKAEKRGRLAGRIARYQQDLWDLERWDAVEEIRRIRKSFRANRELMKKYKVPERRRKKPGYDEKMLEWLRHGTFECAAMYLSGRDAKCSPHAVKKSYREVKCRAGAGSRPDRYHVFEDRFLRRLGIPGINDVKPGTKTFPLFNLTA